MLRTLSSRRTHHGDEDGGFEEGNNEEGSNEEDCGKEVEFNAQVQSFGE
jgi:hypothetical protein